MEKIQTTSNDRARPYVGSIFSFGIILILFFVTRVWLWRNGIKFDIEGLKYNFQFLDPELLKTRPFESIWYLHAQPPLFNIFLAFVLNITPDNPAPLFFWAFKLIALAMLTGSWLLVRQLGGNRITAAAVGIFLALSPGLVGYEHWLFYTLPVAMFLVIAACSLHRFLETGAAWACALYFAMLLALVLTRSTFHPLWFLICGAMPLIALPKMWRKILFCGLPALLLIILLLAKNHSITGSYATSSWLGMSLGKMITSSLTEEERKGLTEKEGAQYIEEKEYPARIYSAEPFEVATDYVRYIGEWPTAPGIPALNETMKSTGWPNMNHMAIVAASKEYKSHFLWAAINKPTAWPRSVWRATQIYLLPSSEYFYLMSNVTRFDKSERRLNALLYGKFGEHPFIKKEPDRPGHRLDWGGRRYGWSMIGLWIPFMLVAAAWRGIGAIRAIRKDRLRQRAYYFTVLFICFQIGWVTFFSIVLEVGENNRFRAQIEPLMVIVAGLCVAETISWLSLRRKNVSVSG